MRELAFGNPYVRPGVSIPPGMWAMYREGYYAAICAALRNMQSVLDERNDHRRAQIKAALAKRNAARSLQPVDDSSGEELRVKFHHVLELVDESGEQSHRNLEGEGPIVVRYTQRAANNAGLPIDDDLTVHLEERKRVVHSAEYPAAPIDTQQKTK